jgi:hypothetical protein
MDSTVFSTERRTVHTTHYAAYASAFGRAVVTTVESTIMLPVDATHAATIAAAVITSV